MKRNVPVQTIMTATLVTVHLGQALSDVRKAMADGGFHHVPVVSGKKLVGILSSTDILRVSYEYQVDPRQVDAILDHNITIEQLMTTEPVKLRNTNTIREAVDIFATGKFHSLPVVDADDNLVGLVTTTDVLRYMAEQY